MFSGLKDLKLCDFGYQPIAFNECSLLQWDTTPSQNLGNPEQDSLRKLNPQLQKESWHITAMFKTCFGSQNISSGLGSRRFSDILMINVILSEGAIEILLTAHGFF